jgi:hypothetical protein
MPFLCSHGARPVKMGLSQGRSSRVIALWAQGVVRRAAGATVAAGTDLSSRRRPGRRRGPPGLGQRVVCREGTAQRAQPIEGAGSGRAGRDLQQPGGFTHRPVAVIDLGQHLALRTGQGSDRGPDVSLVDAGVGRLAGGGRQLLVSTVSGGRARCASMASRPRDGDQPGPGERCCRSTALWCVQARSIVSWTRSSARPRSPPVSVADSRSNAGPCPAYRLRNTASASAPQAPKGRRRGPDPPGTRGASRAGRRTGCRTGRQRAVAAARRRGTPARRGDRGHPHAPNADDRGHRAALQIRERFPAVGILLLSTHTEIDEAVELFSATASRVGYLLKGSVSDLDKDRGPERPTAGRAPEARRVVGCAAGGPQDSLTGYRKVARWPARTCYCTGRRSSRAPVSRHARGGRG